MEFREDRRRKAFEDNLEKIRKHNEEFKNGKHSYKLSPNSLADLTNQQYLRNYVRLIHSAFDEINDQDYVLGNQFDSNDYPSSLDWRDKGFNTRPMNQKSCGSCYAFSIAHSIEGQLFKKLNRIIELRSKIIIANVTPEVSKRNYFYSPQQIVDCSVEAGNHGCAGGSLRTTLKYLESSGGLMREAEYPYTATVINAKLTRDSELKSTIFHIKHNKCSYDRDLAIVNITSWAILPSKNENIMKAILNEVGPIAISINAALKTFQLYSEGIYDDKDCSSTTVNHAMLLIGYGEDYWILKNWW